MKGGEMKKMAFVIFLIWVMGGCSSPTIEIESEKKVSIKKVEYAGKTTAIIFNEGEGGFLTNEFVSSPPPKAKLISIRIIKGRGVKKVTVLLLEENRVCFRSETDLSSDIRGKIVKELLQR